MQTTETFHSEVEVTSKLSELRVTREGLIACAETAISASADVTSNHPNNSRGTYRYHEGTAALRDQFSGMDGWEKETTDNVESILNLLRVIFPAACGVLWRDERVYTQES